MMLILSQGHAKAACLAGKPPSSFIIGVCPDHVEVIWIRMKDGAFIHTPIENMEHIQRFLQIKQFDLDHFHRTEGVPMSVMCSSSMDFPEEFTEKPEVVELAKQIRKGVCQ